MDNVLQQYINLLGGDKPPEFTSDAVMRLSEKLGQTFSQITTTKFRQYFDDIKGLARMANAGTPLPQLKVKLKLIHARIRYDVGRASKRDLEAMKSLEEFIDKSVQKLLSSDEKQLRKNITDFASFFEMIYGHFYYFNKQGIK